MLIAFLISRADELYKLFLRHPAFATASAPQVDALEHEHQIGRVQHQVPLPGPGRVGHVKPTPLQALVTHFKIQAVQFQRCNLS